MDKTNLGEVLTAADGDALARIAAHLVCAWVTQAAASRGVARIAISGGTTPRAMFRILRHLNVPWSHTEWFWVDERAVTASSSRSNYGAARNDLFSHVAVSVGHVHPMPGDHKDLGQAAGDYETTLSQRFGVPIAQAAPVFDLILLGIGDDGHTASLFPHGKEIDVLDRWVVSVAPQADREARLTLTRPVITAARRVVVLAQGAAKKEPLHQARSPGAIHEVPARVTQEVTGELLWLVDAQARGRSQDHPD